MMQWHYCVMGKVSWEVREVMRVSHGGRYPSLLRHHGGGYAQKPFLTPYNSIRKVQKVVERCSVALLCYGESHPGGHGGHEDQSWGGVSPLLLHHADGYIQKPFLTPRGGIRKPYKGKEV